jgi:hypothetical protein
VFQDSYERQFTVWRKFRGKLEKSPLPFEDALHFWLKAPLVNKHLNIFRTEDWPTPWEIIKNGKYDELTISIMIGHTLKLTERFLNSKIEIRQYLDTGNKVVYNTCYIVNKILNYPYGNITEENELPKELVLQAAVELPNYS